MSLFIPLLLTCLGAVLLCFGIGAGIGRLLGIAPRERYFALFLTLVLGLAGLVSAWALVRTGGRTILLPLLLLLLLAGWQLRRYAADEALNAEAGLNVERTGWRGLPLVLGFGLVLFATRWLLLFDAASPFLRTPFQDYVYYGRLFSPLERLGLETSMLDSLYPQFLTTMPYHYVEVWFNIILVQITGLPAAWCLYLATYSALIALVAVGFRAALGYYNLRGAWAALLSLALTLVVGIFWPFFAGHSFLENGTLISGIWLPVQPKLAPIYLLTMLGMLLLLRRRYLAAAMVLATLPLAFISTLPSVGAGMVGLAVYLWWRKKLRLAAALTLLLPVLLTGLYIAIFYFTKAEPFQFPGTGRAYTMASLVPQVSEWHTIINIWLGTLLNFAISYAPYIVVLSFAGWLARRRLGYWPWPARIAPVLCWALVSILTAAAVRAVGTHFLDSTQFFSNPIVPLAACGLALWLAAVLVKLPNHWTAITAGLILLLAFMNGYKVLSHTSPMHVTAHFSPVFLRKVQAALPGLGSRGGYLLGDKDYVSAYTLSPDSYTAGTYVSNFKNDYTLTSLTALNPDSLTTDSRYAHDSAQAEQSVRRSSLYRYAKFRSLAHKPLSLDSTQYYFVKKFRLRFLCASRYAELPATVKPLVQATYVDSLSGEKFYVLADK